MPTTTTAMPEKIGDDPVDWHWDARFGRWYYHNRHTGETKWTSQPFPPPHHHHHHHWRPYPTTQWPQPPPLPANARRRHRAAGPESRATLYPVQDNSPPPPPRTATATTSIKQCPAPSRTRSDDVSEPRKRQRLETTGAVLVAPESFAPPAQVSPITNAPPVSLVDDDDDDDDNHDIIGSPPEIFATRSFEQALSSLLNNDDKDCKSFPLATVSLSANNGRDGSFLPPMIPPQHVVHDDDKQDDNDPLLRQPPGWMTIQPALHKTIVQQARRRRKVGPRNEFRWNDW